MPLNSAVALIVATSLMPAPLEFPVMLLIVLTTAVWATVDVSRLRRRYAAEPSFVPTKADAAILQTSRPIIVFAACSIMWLFGFPWYLVMRHKLVARLSGSAKESDNAAA